MDAEEPGRLWYTACMDDRRQYALLTGPYTTYTEALDNLMWANKYAHDHDDRAPSWSYGIVSTRPGKPALPTAFDHEGNPTKGELL